MTVRVTTELRELRAAPVIPLLLLASGMEARVLGSRPGGA